MTDATNNIKSIKLNWDPSPTSLTFTMTQKEPSYKETAPTKKKMKKQGVDGPGKGLMYVCAVCGNSSYDIHGHTATRPWNQCCRYTNVMVEESSIIRDGDVVKYARSVRA